jgi:DNA polymerase III gamma/tau subunit
MTARNKIEAADPAELSLHVRYRPKELRDVLGQDAVVKSLKQTLDMRARPHCYLFTGPAGTGKTTLGRITASGCGVGRGGIIEVDGASKNGVDDMRGLTEGLAYQGFGENPGKAIIVNECQRLSAQAWDSLLTITEEPPPHAFFIFTSTHPAKIPVAMVTRCQVYNLKPLRRDKVLDVLENVCTEESFNTSNKVLGMVADACGGSMRMALTMLAKVHAIENLDDVASLLEHTQEDAEVIELCRMLVQRRLSWKALTDTLTRMGDSTPPETIRIVVSAYLTKCLIGARGEADAKELLFMLRQFAQPFDTTTKMAPVLLAFGRIMFD